MDQQRINNLAGWVIFSLSLFVYILTIEPTLSLWDCGEFLVSAYKLEINHSPGAPLFMLLGRFFSLLSFGNPDKAAYSINLVSAVSSAATILFLFWTIVWLIAKIEQSQKQQFPLLNLLVIPSIGLIIYFRKYSFTTP